MELQRTGQSAAKGEEEQVVANPGSLTLLRDEKADSVEAAIDRDVQDMPEVPKIVALLLARRQLFQDSLDRATVLRARAWLGAALEEETDDGEPELVLARDEQRLGEERDAEARDSVDGDVGRRQRALPIRFRGSLPDVLPQFIQHVADAPAAEPLGEAVGVGSATEEQL